MYDREVDSILGSIYQYDKQYIQLERGLSKPRHTAWKHKTQQ